MTCYIFNAYTFFSNISISLSRIIRFPQICQPESYKAPLFLSHAQMKPLRLLNNIYAAETDDI